MKLPKIKGISVLTWALVVIAIVAVVFRVPQLKKAVTGQD